MDNHNHVVGAYVMALEVKLNTYAKREVELMELLFEANHEKEEVYNEIESLKGQAAAFRQDAAKDKQNLENKDQEIVNMGVTTQKMKADFTELLSEIEVYMDGQEGVNKEAQYRTNTEIEETCEKVEAFKREVHEAAIRNAHDNVHINNKEMQILALQDQITGQLEQMKAFEINSNQMASRREKRIKLLEFQLRELNNSHSQSLEHVVEQKLFNLQNDKVNDMRNQELTGTEEQFLDCSDMSEDSLENDF